MLRPHCVGPQTHTQETHTLSLSLILSISSFLFPLPSLSSKDTTTTAATTTPSLRPSPPPLSPAPSGLQSYLLTGSESFVTSFQFLTFQLEPRLLPPSANKQENALSEKTVVHRRKSQKRKVGGFDKYILREAPPSPSIFSPSPSVSHPCSLGLPFSTMIPGEGDFYLIFFSVFGE